MKLLDDKNVFRMYGNVRRALIIGISDISRGNGCGNWEKTL
jgi:hypothetical protein